MGSPLGPTFTNIFLADLERKHISYSSALNSENFHKILVYTWLRFVDDTFVTVGKWIK